MMLSPNDAADAYTQAITAHFQQQPVCFDLILLGLGDMLTASLFPHTSVLAETTAAVKAVHPEAATSISHYDDGSAHQSGAANSVSGVWCG